MDRLSISLTFVLLALGLLAAGCCDKEKQQLLTVQQQYNELQKDNQDLKKSLAEAQSANAELTAQLNNRGSQLDRTQEELTKLKAERVQPVREAGGVPEGWTKTSAGVKTTLSSDILFASGRATLSSAGVSKLRSVAATIKSKYPDAVVRVYGYTDDDPIVKSAKLWQDNLDLSANRAMAVTRQLWKLGIPAERVETIGMGATNFVAANTTRAGKAGNRRVEIEVFKQ
jgi:flagellar motor protein MotB